MHSANKCVGKLRFSQEKNSFTRRGCSKLQQAVGGRPSQYAPAPLLPLWAPKRLAPPSRPRLQSTDRNVERTAVGSHGQYVPTLIAATA